MSFAGYVRLVLTPLNKLEEPPSLLTLRAAVRDLLPPVDLPDVMVEVAAWAGFLGDFTHVSEGTARAEDLGVSICAVLTAEVCNVGLEPVVRASTPALTRGRLSSVDQNYLLGDTITAATGRWSRPRARSHSQEDQLGALGLVVNAIVLWNTS